jgi:hypothetical protein
MDPITLSSVDDALAYLTAYSEAEDGPEVVFAGDLAHLHAKIEGADYHGTIPGELARGLTELQDAFYRAAAFALHGDDRINRLTVDERENFELVFSVKQGSSEIDASLGDIWKKLGDGFIKMKSEHRRTVLIVIALAFALGWGGPKLYETHAEIEKAKIEATAEKDRDVEKTRQMTLFAQLAARIPAAERFEKAGGEGARAVIKGAKDADSITLNRAHFDKVAIEEINQRAAKDKAEPKVFTSEFRIVGLESRDRSLKVWLEARGIKQFSVIIGDDDDADADLLHAIWSAARERKLITLEISATYIRGQMKTAQVVRQITHKGTALVYQPEHDLQAVAITHADGE